MLFVRWWAINNSVTFEDALAQLISEAGIPVPADAVPPAADVDEGESLYIFDCPDVSESLRVRMLQMGQQETNLLWCR